MQMILAIASGGALGSVLRHYAGKMALPFAGGGFPVATLFVNIAGSFAMGLLVAGFARYGNPPAALRAFLTVGLLGGFTTFSAFSLDAVTLYERGATVSALTYVALSVAASLAGLCAGMTLIRSLP